MSDVDLTTRESGQVESDDVRDREDPSASTGAVDDTKLTNWKAATRVFALASGKTVDRDAEKRKGINNDVVGRELENYLKFLQDNPDMMEFVKWLKMRQGSTSDRRERIFELDESDFGDFNALADLLPLSAFSLSDTVNLENRTDRSSFRERTALSADYFENGVYDSHKEAVDEIISLVDLGKSGYAEFGDLDYEKTIREALNNYSDDRLSDDDSDNFWYFRRGFSSNNVFKFSESVLAMINGSDKKMTDADIWQRFGLRAPNAVIRGEKLENGKTAYNSTYYYDLAVESTRFKLMCMDAARKAYETGDLSRHSVAYLFGLVIGFLDRQVFCHIESPEKKKGNFSSSTMLFGLRVGRHTDISEEKKAQIGKYIRAMITLMMPDRSKTSEPLINFESGAMQMLVQNDFILTDLEALVEASGLNAEFSSLLGSIRVYLEMQRLHTFFIKGYGGPDRKLDGSMRFSLENLFRKGEGLGSFDYDERGIPKPELSPVFPAGPKKFISIGSGNACLEQYMLKTGLCDQVFCVDLNRAGTDDQVRIFKCGERFMVTVNVGVKDCDDKKVYDRVMTVVSKFREMTFVGITIFAFIDSGHETSDREGYVLGTLQAAKPGDYLYMVEPAYSERGEGTIIRDTLHYYDSTEYAHSMGSLEDTRRLLGLVDMDGRAQISMRVAPGLIGGNLDMMQRVSVVMKKPQIPNLRNWANTVQKAAPELLSNNNASFSYIFNLSPFKRYAKNVVQRRQIIRLVKMFFEEENTEVPRESFKSWCLLKIMSLFDRADLSQMGGRVEKAFDPRYRFAQKTKELEILFQKYSDLPEARKYLDYHVEMQSTDLLERFLTFLLNGEGLEKILMISGSKKGLESGQKLPIPIEDSDAEYDEIFET